jgi:hypothetical protein
MNGADTSASNLEICESVFVKKKIKEGGKDKR